MKSNRLITVVLVVIFALAFFVTTAFSDCTSIIVGKDASVDGSVIVTHNEELSADTAQTVEYVPRMNYEPGDVVILDTGTEIPQVETTWAYIQYNSNYSDLVEPRSYYNANNPNYLNEWQVITTDNASTARDELKAEFPSDGIDSHELKRLVGQRAKTAREGVELMGWAIDTYGFAKTGGGGMMYIIGDSNEAWKFEGLVGKHWAAVRCPDDSVLMIANANRIGEIDLKDTDNFLGSANLVSYAVEKGWYDPASGKPFNFEKAYCNQKTAVSAGNVLRDLQALRFFAPSRGAETIEDLPAYMIFVPDKKVSVEDAMAWQRSHYEGTEFDTSNDYEICPHKTPERVICNISTMSCAVAQLRNWLPNEMACLWLTQGTPCTSVFVPWYLGNTDSPSVYQGATDRHDGEKAWWRFKTIAMLANANYAKLIKIIKPVWEAQEKDELALQETIEKTALELYQKGVNYTIPFLTNYSNAWALNAYYKTEKLIDDCLTVLAQSRF